MLDKMNVTIPPNQIKVEVWPYGAHKGGQHVGVNPGVKITHIDTGTVAICEAARSQHRNREMALEMLETALTHKYFTP